MQLSRALTYLSEEFLKNRIPMPESGIIPAIHVDEVASKIAKFYEQIRNVVDYREEHLLRKNSIFRALQRSILLDNHDSSRIAESLTKEIIRSGHLPNNAIPESAITRVSQLVANLLYFLDGLKN